MGQTLGWGVRNSREELKLELEGGGGSSLLGDIKWMGLDGNLVLVEVAEDNRIYAEDMNEFGCLSGDLKTVYNLHGCAAILTLHSWFHLHK